MRSSSVLLFFYLALFADAALGQSLSIIRKGESEFWIEAAAPPDTRYLLQASGNLHLWVDLNDEVGGQLSHRFDGAGIAKCFFRLTPWTPPAPPIRLVLIGDCTVTDACGWGQGIYGYFKSNVRVVNLAYFWQSTKVFLASEEKTKMLLIKPDVVLVQFGLLDVISEDLTQRTTLREYADNLKTIVQTIRGFNGIPILITPPVPRVFDDKGKIQTVWSMPDRCAVVKDVAAELQTHLIDLEQLSMDLFNELGDSGSFYINLTTTWIYDAIHYSPEGAPVIAGLVVNALPDSLGTYLLGNILHPPKP